MELSPLLSLQSGRLEIPEFVEEEPVKVPESIWGSPEVVKGFSSAVLWAIPYPADQVTNPSSVELRVKNFVYFVLVFSSNFYWWGSFNFTSEEGIWVVSLEELDVQVGVEAFQPQEEAELIGVQEDLPEDPKQAKVLVVELD
ncbi:hypothetical protein C0989_011101 [Termitomyces sp. Mn162]|nr:hypothetical protein C0989_011101 [Termitomyces sp. Mn162]